MDLHHECGGMEQEGGAGCGAGTEAPKGNGPLKGASSEGQRSALRVWRTEPAHSGNPSTQKTGAQRSVLDQSGLHETLSQVMRN